MMHCSLFLLLAILVPSRVQCIPTEQRDAPGVGIDLTMAYATVAIRFENGTTNDLGRIDGSPEYLAAMRSLAQDARQFHHLEAEPEDTYHPRRTFYPPIYILNLWVSIRSWISPVLNKSRPRIPSDDPVDPYLPDAWVDVVAAMLSTVKSEILDPMHLSSNYSVVTAWPDFEADTDFIYRTRFRRATKLAGLDHFAGEPVSDLALAYNYYSIVDDPDLIPLLSLGILVLSYNTASLGVTINKLEHGDPWLYRLSESPHLGAGVNNGTAEYWEEVKQTVERVIQKEPVNYILLLGSHGYNRDLVQALREVFAKRSVCDLALLDRYDSASVTLGTELDEDVPLFTGARQAAVMAKREIERRLERGPGYYGSCVDGASHVHLEL